MIEFGKTLREAREAKGYSVSQLAEMTHILPQIIENLEREDFTKIVAPIYGRGFVKLYCEHVGLDAKPLVAEFMEIYNGNRSPVIRLKEEGEEAQVVDQVQETREEIAPAPEPIAEPPPVASEPPVVSEPLSRPVPPAAPFVPGPDDLPFAEETPPKRDYRLPGYATMSDVPRSFWRFGVLAVAAIVVVVLLVIGSRALYRATMTAPTESEEVGMGEKGESGEKGEKEKTQTSNAKLPNTQISKLPNSQTSRTPRKPVAVPPLYID